MTSRERVKRTLTFGYPDRVSRDLWILPIARNKYEKETKAILERFPPDIGGPQYSSSSKTRIKRTRFEIGTYVDEWGCVWKNIERGIVGQVKEPIVRELSDIDKVKPPYNHLDNLTKSRKQINESCRESDRFILGGGGISPFQRMQYLRGTTNLYMDIMDQSSGFFELRDIVHKYYSKLIETWAKTEVDGITFADDWGAQSSLLISPALWRKLFKPLYKDYCELIHRVGKFAFMHSDGYIFDIYEDLIEMGVDAINSQLFCMNIEEIGRRFKGKITFWGEIDRQHVLPSTNLDEVKRAVKRVKESLYDRRGGVIAQCEFGGTARPENVEEIFRGWEKV